MSIYDILPALDLTQSVHAKISIGMHRAVKFKIPRIPLIGLETRLGWRTDRKFLRNPNLNEISLPDVMFVTRGSKNSLFFVFDFLSNLDCGLFCWMIGHFLLRIATRRRDSQGGKPHWVFWNWHCKISYTPFLSYAPFMWFTSLTVTSASRNT
jgi:hypothetical protein